MSSARNIAREVVSTAAVTMQDPLVRAFSSLARWDRGRQLALAAILGTAAFGIGPVFDTLVRVVVGPPPPEETKTPWSAVTVRVAKSPGRMWAHMGLHWEFPRYAPALEPRIEIRYGTWVARDLLGIDKIELPVETEPEAVEAALRAWAARICAAEPRPLYAFNLDPDQMDELTPVLLDACPNLLVYRADFLALPH